MTATGNAGIVARKAAAESMMKSLLRSVPGFEPAVLDLVPWPQRLTRFQQGIRQLRDVLAGPAELRDRTTIADLERMGPDGINAALAQLDMGQRVVEQCFRDIGGEVK